MFSKPLVIVALVVVLLLSAGTWFYAHRAAGVATTPKPSPQTSGTASPSAPAASPSGEVQPKPIDTPPFAALAAPPAPAFLKSVATSNDVNVSFFYEGDDRSADEDVFYTERTTVPNRQGEKYLLMPSSVDPAAYRYGPLDFSIFRNQESHSYQGIPISILNPSAGYSLEYVALKINNANLVGSLSVEMGIDYRAADDGDATDTPSPSPSPTGLLQSWFSPTVAYACGPGIYLRPVGTSRLVPVELNGDVAWYKLEKPIVLRNLALNFCDNPNPKRKKKKKRTTVDDDVDENAYCAGIKDLASGNLRLHVRYQPRGATGVLQIQALNFILSDSQGKYFQPTIGHNFNHYYKAYLVDPSCAKSDQPAKCIGG
jgi:hypothetical protein